jgi:hypothetical protein
MKSFDISIEKWKTIEKKEERKFPIDHDERLWKLRETMSTSCICHLSTVK